METNTKVPLRFRTSTKSWTLIRYKEPSLGFPFSMGLRSLRRVAKVLKETEGIQGIRIDGHTDSDPIRRSGFKSNEHLSLERAKLAREKAAIQEKIADLEAVIEKRLADLQTGGNGKSGGKPASRWRTRLGLDSTDD